MTHTAPVNSYDIGDGIVLEADFSQEGEAVPPTSVTCVVRAPRSDPATVATTHVGTVTLDDGTTAERYKADFIPDTHGDHYYRFEGDGIVQAAGEQRFYVKPSKVLI